MTTVNLHQVTALPSSLEKFGIYYVSVGDNHTEIYVTGSNKNKPRRVLNESDINSLIATATSGLGSLNVVDDIAARNALSLDANGMVLVLDASADSTVASGAATYAYRVADKSWHKVSEAESLDVALSWANLTGKPSSSVSDIEAAVARKHSHANKTQLDKIGQDSNGNMTYGGKLPAIAWETLAW